MSSKSDLDPNAASKGDQDPTQSSKDDSSPTLSSKPYSSPSNIRKDASDPAEDISATHDDVRPENGESQGSGKTNMVDETGQGRRDRGGGSGIPDGGAGSAESDPPDGGGEQSSRPKSKRQTQPTEKALDYTISMRTKSLNSCISKYRKSVAQAETTIADSNSVESLRECHDILEWALDEVSAAHINFGLVCYGPDYNQISVKVDQIEVSHLNLLGRITDKILDIELEERSQRSSRSRSSHRSSWSRNSHNSHISARSNRSHKSTSEKMVEAAVDLAALQMEQAFIEVEANQRAELEKIQLKKRVKVVHARLAVLSESLEENESNSPARQLDATAAPFVPASTMTTKVTTSSVPMVTSQVPKTNLKQPVYIAPPSSHHLTDSLKANFDDLALRLTDQVNLSRYPAPEPGIFSGEAMQYPGWKLGFDVLVDQKSIVEAEKLFYLKRYLSGSAREVVEDYLLIPTGESYRAARQLLEERYGDPCSVANAFRDRLENWPNVPARDGIALRKLSDFLQQCLLAMSTNPSLNILCDERENKKILMKLPDWFNSRWVRIVSDWRLRTGQFPLFREFARAVAKEAKIACDPSASLQALVRAPKNGIQSGKPDKAPRLQGLALATGAAENKVATTQSKPPWCSLCCKNVHQLEECKAYLDKPYDERRQFIIHNNLCFGCLRKGHRSKECRSKKTCKTCNRKHPTSLHTDTPPTPRPDNTSTDVNTEAKETVSGNSYRGSTLGASNKTSTIVPVLVSHESDPDNEQLVYAMLDSQSDTSFVLEDTRRALNAEGTPVDLLLSTMTSTAKSVPCIRVMGLRVRGFNSNIKIMLPAAYSRQVMPTNQDHIPTPDLVDRWPHLHNIKNELSPLLDVKVGFLIGCDCPQALVPRDVVPHPTNNGPFGQRTDLGWSVVGVVTPEAHDDDAIGLSHRIFAREISCPQDDTQSEIIINTTIQEAKVPTPMDVLYMMNLDFVEHDGPLGGECYSQDNIKFLRMMEDNILTCADGHYEMPLPLNPSRVPQFSNRENALLRLKSLERRFDKDPKYKESYVANMNDLLQNGYAEPPGPSPGQAWYLPHHGVQHARKPGKLKTGV